MSNVSNKASSNDVIAVMGVESQGGDNTLLSRKRKCSGNGEETSEPPPPPALPRLKQEISANDALRCDSLKEGHDFSQSLELESVPASENLNFIAADNRRKDNERNVLAAHSRVVELRSELHRVQSMLENAQKAYDDAIALSREHSEQDADNLLLEPTEWNSHYLQLRDYFDREGHSHLKRSIADDEVEDILEEGAMEFRTLSRWACRQRKLKRSGDLEHFKVLLLDRLNFNWDPKTGQGSEKWLKNYNLLKEFKQGHKHVNVPMQYGDNRLGSWVKAQLSLYRNGKEGKLPALSAKRIRMLEELGITWGERRKQIPWEERFEVLLDYKKQYGHANVPWQWKDNVALAQWVNTQRKKYKDQMDGKKTNLTAAQIDLLNSIGFKWSTGGKGRYTTDPFPKDQSSEKMPPSNAVSTVQPKLEFPEVTVAKDLLSSNSSGSSMAASSNPLMMTTNLPQGFAETSQNGSADPNAMAQNSLANFLGGPTNFGIGANQQNAVGGTGLQAQMTAGLSIPAQTQALQHLLTQQFVPQGNNNNGIGVQQAQTMQTLQQLLNNQQVTQNPSHNGSINALQASQNNPAALSNRYQQLLNQQMNQSSGNIALGVPQASNAAIAGGPQVSQNNLSVLFQAYQRIQNNQPSPNPL